MNAEPSGGNIEISARRVTIRRSAIWLIAEVVVIVIGVFVAISFDSWLAERRDLRSEQALLISLDEEFESAALVLQEQMSAYLNRTNAARGLIADRDLLSSLSNDSLSALWQWATRGGTYDYPSGVLRSATSSGDLALIRNAELRAALARWPSDVQDFTNIEVWVEDLIHNQLIPIGREHFELPSPYAFGITDRPSTFNSQVGATLSLQLFQNLFREEVTWWEILLATSPEPELNEIRALLARELSG